MKPDRPASPVAAPLDHRIDALENRIALRQAAAATHHAELQGALRNKLRSPLVLLLAAGTGFAIGQLARPRVRVDGADPAAATPGPPPLLPTLLSVLSLIGPITTLMAQLKPRAQSKTDAPTGQA